MLIKFEVYKDGRWWGARALGHAIFTQGRTLDEVYKNIKEAAHLHFEDEVQKGEMRLFATVLNQGPVDP